MVWGKISTPKVPDMCEKIVANTRHSFRGQVANGEPRFDRAGASGSRVEPFRKSKRYELNDPPTMKLSILLSWITGAARSVACGTGGSHSGNVSLCNGSEHAIVSTRRKVTSKRNRLSRFWANLHDRDNPFSHATCSTIGAMTRAWAPRNRNT